MKKLIFLFALSCFIFGCAPSHLTDQNSVAAALAQDLARLPSAEKTLSFDSKIVKEEALLIAKALVDQTQKTNAEFQMVRPPLWHNFLIKLGLKKKGYCYHWVPELLKSLPQHPLQAFERHWGGSSINRLHENNALILTRRGAPLATGIAYDAWRGVGRSWWKKVAEDKKYRWEERFTESQILRGEAKVEGK